MTGPPLTYRVLSLEIKKRVIEYALKKGHGGPLALLAVLGAGLMFTVFNMPLLGILWVAVCLCLGGFMVNEYLNNPKLRNKFIRWVIQKKFSNSGISDPELYSAVSRGVEIFSEIVVKIAEIIKAHGLNEDLSRVLADADGMISLGIESAERVEKFRGVLNLLSSGSSRASPRTKTKNSNASETTELLEENIIAIKKEIIEEQSLVSEIVAKLETLMAQVSLMDKRASDRVRTARFAEESNDSLRNLQAVVNARRETADTVIRRVIPERG